MKPEDINRKIAELCGWTQIDNNRAPMLGVPIIRGYPPKGALVGKKQPIRDYWNDLNACVEFEATLSTRELEQYADTLCDMYSNDDPDPDISGVITASAEERCEAFLKVKKQWK